MASDRCAQVLGADSADSESANYIERPPAPPGKAHSGASWHRELEVGFMKNLNYAQFLRFLTGRNPGVGSEQGGQTTAAAGARRRAVGGHKPLSYRPRSAGTDGLTDTVAPVC